MKYWFWNPQHLPKFKTTGTSVAQIYLLDAINHTMFMQRPRLVKSPMARRDISSSWSIYKSFDSLDLHGNPGFLLRTHKSMCKPHMYSNILLGSCWLVPRVRNSTSFKCLLVTILHNEFLALIPTQVPDLSWSCDRKAARLGDASTQFLTAILIGCLVMELSGELDSFVILFLCLFFSLLVYGHPLCTRQR